MTARVTWLPVLQRTQLRMLRPPGVPRATCSRFKGSHSPARSILPAPFARHAACGQGPDCCRYLPTIAQNPPLRTSAPLQSRSAACAPTRTWLCRRSRGVELMETSSCAPTRAMLDCEQLRTGQRCGAGARSLPLGPAADRAQPVAAARDVRAAGRWWRGRGRSGGGRGPRRGRHAARPGGGRPGAHHAAAGRGAVLGAGAAPRHPCVRRSLTAGSCLAG